MTMTVTVVETEITGIEATEVVVTEIITMEIRIAHATTVIEEDVVWENVEERIMKSVETDHMIDHMIGHVILKTSHMIAQVHQRIGLGIDRETSLEIDLEIDRETSLETDLEIDRETSLETDLEIDRETSQETNLGIDQMIQEGEDLIKDAARASIIVEDRGSFGFLTEI